MKRILLTAAVVIATGGVAFATDAPAYEGMGQAAHDWSGSYVGLQIGGAFGHSRAYIPGGATTDEYDMSGVIGGYTSGYNWQRDSLVFGIDMDTSLTGLKGSTSVNCTACFSEVNWLSTARVRLGKTVGSGMGDALLYVTGGLAYGGTEVGASGVASEKNVKFGWTAGAGGEIALNENWSAKAEYLFVDLGETTHPSDNTHFKFDNIHVVRVGVNRKFSILKFLGIR